MGHSETEPKVRVLVVDDEVAQMRALCDTLREHNYDVTGYAECAAALTAVRASRFDLLLADLVMPEMDGITLLRTAREMDPDLVGIIMTGAGTIASAVEAMKAGALDYILKPFRLSGILPVLSRAVAMRRLCLENAKLEQRVHQRTAELEVANEALSRRTLELDAARVTAEEGTRAKAAFLATMSHEIRTPLNAIIGVTGLLEDTSLDDGQREFVDIARTSSEHLLGLINDVLDFSRGDAGKLELERQYLNLPVCIEDSLDLVTSKADAKALELAYVYDRALPSHFFGDAGRVRQVLVNLLGNAVKFTAKGEVVVAVTGEQRNSRYMLRVSVRDTGIGIPGDRLHRLFQAFSQVDASTTREYGGTGLGLAISKRIAEAMGGHIEVESKVGVGSTFHFTFVAEEAPAPALPRRRSKELPRRRSTDLPRRRLPTPPPGQLQALRALIVVDNDTIRGILQQYCESWGMGVVGAASSAQALEVLGRGERCDIAVLDYRMPRMDGIALAREIRRRFPASPIKIILLASAGSREAAARAADSAIQGVVTKPVHQSALYAALAYAIVPPSEYGSPLADTLTDPVPPPFASLRVLLVEDNATNQFVAQLMLKKLGQNVDTVANGREAVLAAGRASYDLILMDMLMPEMDGLEATRHIRQQLPESRQPRIVAMTANVSTSDRDSCREAGMDDYISKPISVDTLADVIRQTQRLKPTMPPSGGSEKVPVDNGARGKEKSGTSSKN